MNISVIGGADGPTAIYLVGSLGNKFMIPAFLILAIFYGIYFTKQFVQKRQGIQTRQLGRRKERAVHLTEVLLSLATYLIVPIQLISIVLDWNIMPLALRIVGIILGVLGDLLFLVAVVTMKNSWRAGIPKDDQTEFVCNGIYRYSRNPAFLGFDLMYVGILCMYFNGILLAFTVWAVVMLHLQMIQEENYLLNVFGEEYVQYKERTGRYFGKKK